MKIENNHMIAGTGEDSYAHNSLIQKFDEVFSMAWTIEKVFPMVRDALEGLYSTILPKCVMAAELGCASGPNTLMLIPELMDITYKAYNANKNWQGNNKNDHIPEIKVFLNDLPGNDFNTVSQSLATFNKQLDEERNGDIVPYFISTTPGSFHKRLFPANFLHFVHTSSSANWLSQVPKGLVSKNGEFVNKGNIFIGETSPPQVIEAYQKQFKEDFTSSLECRAKEIFAGGRMVISIMATTETHRAQDIFFYKFLIMALQSMAHEGLIDEKKLDPFDFPWYPPTTKEVKKLIEDEGSFLLHKHEIFSVQWDLPSDTNKLENTHLLKRAKFVTGPIKSTFEYMLSSHFGKHVMEDLFFRFTELVAKELAVAKVETFHHAISLIKN